MLIWDHLLPMRSFTGAGGVLHSYYVVDLLRLRLNLTTSELSALCYLYQVTGKGAKIVHSDIVYNSVILPHLLKCSKSYTLTQLRIQGYIIRLNRDPSQPYLSRFRSNNPVFIQMTPKGVNTIHNMEKDIYRLLLSSSLDDLTGVNNKGQTNI